MRLVLRIAGYTARDLSRSRWLAGYASFLALSATLLLRFSDSETKALLGLMNVTLMLVPLANVVFGCMYLYASREFVELLLAQPVRRSRLFAGLLLGLAGPSAAASFVGLAAPLFVNGVACAPLETGILLAAVAATLSAAFTAMAAAIAFAVEDRVRGLALAIGAWLLLAVAYDALVLLAAVQFADYPLERAMLAAMFANPIDLARLFLLRQFDIAAMLGYTGALFHRYLGGVAGQLLAASAAILWVAVPALAGTRLFSRKDF